MKKVFYIITIILLNSCQDDKIEGTWVGDYTYPTNYQNGDVVLPLQKLMRFKNGKAFYKGSKNNFGKESIEGDYSILSKNIKFKETFEKYRIKLVTNDSLVLINNSSSFVQILRRLPDTLKNDKNLKLIGNKYNWENKKFSDQIFFRNDSILNRKSNYGSNSNGIHWERAEFNGFDIIFMDGDVPYIIDESKDESIILWTYNKELLEHKFKKIK